MRAFKVDQHVTPGDGNAGYVHGDNGGHEESRPYSIAICERDEERSCSASELVLWERKAGGKVNLSGRTDFIITKPSQWAGFYILEETKLPIADLRMTTSIRTKH
jgi:hypothetical protein